MAERHATHAGSWYTNDPEQLDQQLQGWLDRVPGQVQDLTDMDRSVLPVVEGARAIIGPHAGYSYSGSNAAYAYKSVSVDKIKRVFLLGPSHHVYLEGCALTQCAEYQTPLGNIRIDQGLVAELKAQQPGDWSEMSMEADEDEHSLEMHLPYIYKIFEHRIDHIRLVPILVGNLRFSKEQKYGRLLAKYLQDEENLFVVSSDFCHWGRRFQYTHYQASQDTSAVQLRSTKASQSTPIWRSIEALDFRGMQAIAELDHPAFNEYLQDTRNTICGRHPIGVLLAAVNHLHPAKDGARLRFIKYDQSSQVASASDSSVSYASAYLHLPIHPSHGA